MDKYFVSELRKMCKQHNLKISKNGKPLRKIELKSYKHRFNVLRMIKYLIHPCST